MPSSRFALYIPFRWAVWLAALGIGITTLGAASLPPAQVSNAPASITITTQPLATVAKLGQTATFTVAATSDAGAITYQWYRKLATESFYTAIAGATGASCTTPVLALTDSASYFFVRMTLGAVVQDSNRVPLTVTPLITISTQPAATTSTVGQTATFSVAATANAGAITYQWYRKDASATVYSAIAGATSASCTTPALTSADNGAYYFVRLTDAGATADSTRVPLTVKPSITISKQPVFTVSRVGQTATFSVGAVTSSGSISYQWYQKPSTTNFYTLIAGATGSSYTTPALVAGDQNSYYFARLTNSGTVVDSTRVPLRVDPAITITTQPVATAAKVGKTASFSVTASTTSGVISYQWYRMRSRQGETVYTAIAGATGKSYTTQVLAINDQASYFFARMTNASTVVDTARVALTVTPTITITTQPKATSLNAGQTATFSVSASTDGAGISYQWYRKLASASAYTAITGATGASFTTANLIDLDDASYYFVRMTDTGTVADSSRVPLHVTAAQTTAYLYSDTYGTAPIFGTLTSEVFSGNNDATMDLASTAVPALEGSHVIALTWVSSQWGGGRLHFSGPVDLSGFTSVTFSLNTTAQSGAMGFLEFALIEAPIGNTGTRPFNSVNVASYTPTVAGSWKTYTIPLAEFMTRMGPDDQGTPIDLKTVDGLSFAFPEVAQNGAPILGPLYIDSISFSHTAPPPATYLYSDTYGTAPLFGTLTSTIYSQNNDTTMDLASTAVPAQEGSHVISLTTVNLYSEGLIEFSGPVDLSGFTSVTFSINTTAQSGAMGYLELMLREETRNHDGFYLCNSVNVESYTPSVTGNWKTYTIPLVDFVTKTGLNWLNSPIDLKNVTSVGFVNPSVSSAGPAVPGPLYIDAISFNAAAPPSATYLYSDTHEAAAMFGVITSGTSSDRNDATLDLASTAVPAEEGVHSIALDSGSGAWGGGYLMFTNQVDLSGFTSIMFSLNTSAQSPALDYLELQFAQTVGTPAYNSVNLALYTPIVSGNWKTYTVPLSTFKTVVGPGYANTLIDLKTVNSIGFWEPMHGGVLVRGPLYIDDIHLLR